MNTKLKTSELNRPDKTTFRKQPKVPVVIALEDIRSRNNVGSVFRSADAFAIEGVALCGYTSIPPHRDIQKTALGATETVEWMHFEKVLDCIEIYRSKGYRIYAVEQTSRSIDLTDFPFDKKQPLLLILGNEVNGVSVDAINSCDGTIEIKQFGTKHSLNVAVCAGIVMHWANRQLLAPSYGLKD